MIPCHVCVFLRPVVPGEVKTRLSASLGSQVGASLYAAFARDCIRCAVASGYPGSLWIAGQVDHPSIAVLQQGTGAEAWPRLSQPQGDLGSRQRAALSWALEQASTALAIGTDAPTLSPVLLTQAHRELGRSELVLGPAADGGYYLIGLRAPLADGFLRGVRWSSRHTLADTLASAGQVGYRTRLLPPFYDVDRPRDLALLRMHVALDPAVAPDSARALAAMGAPTYRNTSR